MRPGLAASLLLSLSLSIASTAHAQTYRCNSGGTTYLSDRPCSAVQASTQLRAYGPARSAVPSYSTALPGAPKAEDHVKYLGPDCASISEAIRTGPARGVRGDVIQSLHSEYRQKCAVEDQDARLRAQQDSSLAMGARLAQRDGAARERQQAQRSLERCNGMRDVIALKRKRESTLNATEVQALRDTERTYNETCVGR